MANDKQAVDPGLVRELANILRDADLSEIEVEQGELKIRVSKPAAPVTVSAPVAVAAPQPVAAPVAAAPVAAPAAAAAAPAASDDDAITSPMVGSFYSAPSPDADPFVTVGSTVTENTVVAIIEAMKVMNEIKAGVSGTISEILVKDAEAVEFGQPIFKVKRG